MSSLFPDFTNLFRVGKTISQNSNTDPNDVLNTKTALAQTGDYQVPDFGITDIPDMGMIDGLKKFQQKNGLKVDGVMKPGGPTESKIGETLAGQGVSTVDPLASNTSKPKPKPTKIDPLTGLPEVKMPKLKKPTNTMLEQAANQQKPQANPWFKSTKLQPVSDEAHAENTRTMNGMLNYSENGFLPTLYADAVKNGGNKAIAEYANFLNQLSDRKKDRADGFEQEVMNKLPDNQKQAILALAADNQERNNDYQTFDGQEEPKANDQATASEMQKPDSQFCQNLKPKYQAAKRKYDDANNKWEPLWKKYEQLGRDNDTLRGNIQQGLFDLIPGVAISKVIDDLLQGNFQKASRRILRYVAIQHVKDIINDINQMAENDREKKRIKPDLDKYDRQRDTAWNDYEDYRNKAVSNNCQYHGW